MNDKIGGTSGAAKTLRTPKRFAFGVPEQAAHFRRRTACGGESGDGDRKQSARAVRRGVSGDVVPNGWPSDANLERGSRHIPLSNKTADLYFSTMCTALLRLTSPSCRRRYRIKVAADRQ